MMVAFWGFAFCPKTSLVSNSISLYPILILTLGLESKINSIFLFERVVFLISLGVVISSPRAFLTIWSLLTGFLGSNEPAVCSWIFCRPSDWIFGWVAG